MQQLWSRIGITDQNELLEILLILNFQIMCVECKPYTSGNKRHTICCDLTYILWRYQIVEGKYCPQPLGKKEYNELGKR